MKLKDIVFTKPFPSKLGETLIIVLSVTKSSFKYWVPGASYTNFRYAHGDFNLPIKVLGGKVAMHRFHTEFPLIGFREAAIRPNSQGSDPEIFVESGTGELLPAFMFLPNKEQPVRTVKVHEEVGNRAVYWDGFQAEFETWGTSCLAWQIDSIQLGLKTVLQEARKIDPNAKLSLKSVYNIPVDMLKEGKIEHVELGCAPSYNIYGLKAPKFNCRDIPFRSAGGHIHIGLDGVTEDVAKNMVRAMDYILGVACVSLFAGYDDVRRRQFYGMPGEYRRPPHGLEYRTLSNTWLCHPLIANLVMELGRRAAMIGKNNALSAWKAEEKDVIDCIMTGDVNKAKEILTVNKNLFIAIFNAANLRSPEKIFDVFYNGLSTAINNPTDLEGNWNLCGKWITHSDGIGKNWKFSVDTLIKGDKVA
jgi:hypothetical protein